MKTILLLFYLVLFVFIVLADAIAFIVIVVTDVSLPGLVYPFIFYIQVCYDNIIDYY